MNDISSTVDYERSWPSTYSLFHLPLVHLFIDINRWRNTTGITCQLQFQLLFEHLRANAKADPGCLLSLRQSWAVDQWSGLQMEDVALWQKLIWDVKGDLMKISAFYWRQWSLRHSWTCQCNQHIRLSFPCVLFLWLTLLQCDADYCQNMALHAICSTDAAELCYRQ